MIPYIAVDLDGTLAKYDGWKDDLQIGEPVAPMVERVKGWLDEGIKVKIMTARITAVNNEPFDKGYRRLVYKAYRTETGSYQ